MPKGLPLTRTTGYMLLGGQLMLGDANWYVRSSATGNSGSFETIEELNIGNSDEPDYANCVAIDSNNCVYVARQKGRL